MLLLADKVSKAIRKRVRERPDAFRTLAGLNDNMLDGFAILSTEDFDVQDVDIDTLLFGDPVLIDSGGTAVSPLRFAYDDVSGDGLMDLSLLIFGSLALRDE